MVLGTEDVGIAEQCAKWLALRGRWLGHHEPRKSECSAFSRCEQSCEAGVTQVVKCPAILIEHFLQVCQRLRIGKGYVTDLRRVSGSARGAQSELVEMEQCLEAGKLELPLPACINHDAAILCDHRGRRGRDDGSL